MRRILLVLIVGAALATPAALLLRTAVKAETQASAQRAPASVRAPSAAMLPASIASSQDAPPTAAHLDAAQLAQVALSLGMPDSDLVYNRGAPCRIVDTRLAGGRLQSGETRNYNAAAASFVNQGGIDGNCGILADAPAVVLNIVAVQADEPGYLIAHAYGTPRPNVSSLNYEAGEIVANEAVVRTTASAEYDFSVYSLHGVHLVIDIAGYFAPPVATKPQCVTTYGDWVSVPAGTQASATAACPATGDYAMVSGGCNWDLVNLQLIQYGQIAGYSNDQGGYSCDADNPTQSEVRFHARTLCCRVPGR